MIYIYINELKSIFIYKIIIIIFFNIHFIAHSQNDDLRTMLLSLDPEKIEQLRALGDGQEGIYNCIITLYY